MSVEIVGRNAEQEAVERFVAGLAIGPRGLAIDGEAGMGKSTLWQEAVAAAEAGGTRVLTARPASGEVRLSFSGLGDLFERVIDEFAPRLPPPQRAALEVALYRVPAVEPIEAGIVGVATLHALRILALERSLVIAVDDVQWLDAPSQTALEYTVRRLRDERVGILTATRIAAEGTAGDPAPAGLAELLPDELVERRRLGPIAVGALHHLLRTRLDLSLPRPLLVRVHGQSGGNPLYALELARDLAARRSRAGASTGADGGTETRDVVPASLRDLLRRRLDVLPDATRHQLLVVALAAQPTADLVGRVTAISEAAVEAALEPARQAGVLETQLGDGSTLRIGHPLLAAAVVDTSAAAERREVHRRLGELASDPEERARHLAASSSAPSLEVASALATASDLAAARGAIATAVELLDDAVQRWPAEDTLGRQRVLVKRAERVFLAGDTTRAHAELAAIVPTLEDAALRLDAEILLATLIVYDGDARDACRLLETTLELTADPAERARIHARLAWMYDHDLAAGARHARNAVDLLDADADPGLYSFALMSAAAAELQLGQPPDHAAIWRGHEIQERVRSWEFSTLPANWSKWMDDFDRSRELTELYVQRARDTGDESSIAHLLSYLVELECWAGRMTRAEELADEAVDAADQTGQPTYLSAALARRALVHATRGRLKEARVGAMRAGVLAVEMASPLLESLGLAVLAFIEISAGDLAATAVATDRALELVDGTGMRDHPMFRFHADQIEAHIGLGELDVAERLLERHEERNRIAPRPSLELTGLRCRALLTASRGDVAGGLAFIDRAIAMRESVGMPLEIGRMWLVAGQLHRRAGQRRAAATAIEAAIAVFNTLGAAVWLERATGELQTLGLSRGPADELTPSELRIATMAAGGMTNREVADRLVISPKTVEASLARAYQKLGIHRRAELGARLGRS